MSITIVTPPANEPVSLAEAKLFLRVDHDAEDDLVAALIVAARQAVEAWARRALITRRIIETKDQWCVDALDAVRLRLAPIAALHEIRVSGDVVPAETYALDAAHDPPRLRFSISPPSPSAAIAGIEIEYDAGYGANAQDVPEALRQAVRLALAAAYEDRAGAIALPEAARALIGPFRILHL
ncbi:MAG: head-tail connector protein [Pseudomonadota bacterium]